MAKDYPEFPAQARAFAVCLTGVLHGKTRIGLDARPGKELTYLLDMAAIAWINAGSDSVQLVRPATGVHIINNESSDGSEEILARQGEVLIKRVSGLKSTGLVAPVEQLAQTLSGARGTILSGQQVMAERETGREDSMDRVMKRLRGSEMETYRGDVYNLAEAICRVKGWEDLLITSLTLGDRAYILENRPGKRELRVEGHVLPEYRIKNAAEARKRIAGLSDNELRNILRQPRLATLVAKITALP